ncbi:MAG TPA: hypothetical protein VL357_07070 [Rariglobus sp.]|jgi:hypothetical protein|nr:hypothetical protein [Rariglobus sp.]
MSPAEQKRKLLGATIVILGLAAILVLLLPLKLPFPLRLAVAGTDVIIALMVFVAWRQSGSSR